MKKYLLLTTALICFFITAKAQITITSADVAAPLTKFIRYTDTIPLQSNGPGASGANQVWTFSGMQTHEVDTVIFSQPDWTPYATDFPNSNLCVLTVDDQTSYTFLHLSPDSLIVNGFAGMMFSLTSPVTVNINPPSKLVDFPSTYLSSFTNTSKLNKTMYYGQTIMGIPVDSVRVKNTTITSSLVDGWGSVSTPLGTYNCLRQKIKATTNDSIWARSFGMWVDLTGTFGGIDSTLQYSWWANGIGYSILEHIVDPVTDSLLSIAYLDTLGTPGRIVETVFNSFVNIYPNPACEQIIINSGGEINEIYLYNSIGQLVRSFSIRSNMQTIRLDDISNGTYIIRCQGENLPVNQVFNIVIHHP